MGNGALLYKHADGNINIASDKTTRSEKGQTVPEIFLQMKPEEIRVAASLRLSPTFMHIICVYSGAHSSSYYKQTRSNISLCWIAYPTTGLSTHNFCCFQRYFRAVHLHLSAGMSLALELPSGVPLSQIPAAVPPAGVTPNFKNPPSLVPATICVCTVMVSLTLFFVATRVYMAFQLKHKLALDECTRVRFSFWTTKMIRLTSK